MKKMFFTLLISFSLFTSTANAAGCILTYYLVQTSIDAGFAVAYDDCDIVDTNCLQEAEDQYYFASGVNTASLILCCATSFPTC